MIDKVRWITLEAAERSGLRATSLEAADQVTGHCNSLCERRGQHGRDSVGRGREKRQIPEIPERCLSMGMMVKEESRLTVQRKKKKHK